MKPIIVFNMNSFRKLKRVSNKYKTSYDALTAIEKVYTINNNYREKILSLYEE